VCSLFGMAPAPAPLATDRTTASRSARQQGDDMAQSHTKFLMWRRHHLVSFRAEPSQKHQTHKKTRVTELGGIATSMLNARHSKLTAIPSDRSVSEAFTIGCPGCGC